MTSGRSPQRTKGCFGTGTWVGNLSNWQPVRRRNRINKKIEARKIWQKNLVKIKKNFIRGFQPSWRIFFFRGSSLKKNYLGA
jgi:hypothetical protein